VAIARLVAPRGEKLARESESGRAMRIGQVSKLPDADETSGQNELGETAEELARRKGHLALLVAIAKHLGGSAKCGFRVYDPVFLEESIDQSGKTLWIL
jgi:hypothetical protein